MKFSVNGLIFFIAITQTGFNFQGHYAFERLETMFDVVL